MSSTGPAIDRSGRTRPAFADAAPGPAAVLTLLCVAQFMVVLDV
jgi:hypothetical protein